VVVPNRRSLEAAAPLASRDNRIGTIHVANDPGGAELSVVFKDGVPNYQVRAKGDTLEILLAPPGALKGKEEKNAKHEGHDVHSRHRGHKAGHGHDGHDKKP
jgi:hypothetical protein